MDLRTPSLVLFDIDGTLTRRAGVHHRRALESAVHAVTGVRATTEGVPVHGMLDHVILMSMMRAAGIPEQDARSALPNVIAAAQDAYLSADVPDIRDKRCPGVPDVLERLERQGAILVLVTGNLTRIAWHKLGRAGIAGYFRYGMFGEMASTRGYLAKMAIARARAEGLIAEHSQIALVGDADSDILAARDAGIRSIAVRTGIAPEEELTGAGPDFLLDDLTAWSDDLLT